MNAQGFPRPHSPTEANPPVVTVKIGGKEVRTTYPELFTQAYGLWLHHRYEDARPLFKHLLIFRERGPRSHILYAHCSAMLGDFSDCCRILSEGLPDKVYGNACSDLHDCFVMWRCGFPLEVRKGLEKVIEEHAQLPTPCLILSSFLLEMGNVLRPPEFLKMAIDRDFPGGAVGNIARHYLPAALKAANTAILKTKRRRNCLSPAARRTH